LYALWVILGLSVLYSDSVVLDLAPTDLDLTEDGEAIEHPLVDEITPSGSHDLAIILYRARDAPEGEGSGHPTGGTCFFCGLYIFFPLGLIMVLNLVSFRFGCFYHFTAFEGAYGCLYSYSSSLTSFGHASPQVHYLRCSDTVSSGVFG